MIIPSAIIVAGLAIGSLGHADHENQTPMSGPHKSLWYNTLPGDGGTQVCHISSRDSCSRFFFRDNFFFFFLRGYLFCGNEEENVKGHGAGSRWKRNESRVSWGVSVI